MLSLIEASFLIIFAIGAVVVYSACLDGLIDEGWESAYVVGAIASLGFLFCLLGPWGLFDFIGKIVGCIIIVILLIMSIGLFLVMVKEFKERR